MTAIALEKPTISVTDFHGDMQMAVSNNALEAAAAYWYMLMRVKNTPASSISPYIELLDELCQELLDAMDLDFVDLDLILRAQAFLVQLTKETPQFKLINRTLEV